MTLLAITTRVRSPLRRIYFGVLALCVVVAASAIGFRLIGGYGWMESLWMVVITISTVGFSEHSDSSPAVMALEVAVILVGVTAAAYVGTGFIQLMLMGEIERALGRNRMTRGISKLSDHVIICGYGRLGKDLAEQLRHRGLGYVVIDNDPDEAERIGKSDVFFVIGDATDESVLEKASLSHAKTLVAALPDDAQNVFIALTARNLSPQIQIIAKAEHESSCRKLRQAGADKIVMPHRVGAQQMERMISRPTTADMVELFAEATQHDVELDEFLVRPGCRLVGRTVGSSSLRDQYNLLVVGIKKNRSGEMQLNPPPGQEIEQGDTLLLIGHIDAINRMKSDF